MAKLLVKGLLGVLDLAHIKVSNTTDGIALVDDGWGLALGLAQHNVQKVSKGRHGLDRLEAVLAAHPVLSVWSGLGLPWL